MDATNQDDSARTPATVAERVFRGEGEMARLMRATDWSRTPLGPVDQWSPTLRMMVRFLLPNRFPLLLWWGPEFRQIYNDPYRPVLGSKHPHSLGQAASECWAEIWDVIGPLIETPFNGGPATWMEDIFLEIDRHGFMEETHFTIAYSPLPDDDAPRGIGGVLATVHEISEKVVGERRVAVLRDLGARSTEAKTAQEACQIAAETLGQQPKDVPFALLYLLDADGKHARLAATAGVAPESPLGPPVIALTSEGDSAGEIEAGGAAEQSVWPFAEVVRAESPRVVDALSSRFASVPAGPWSDPPTSAVVVPIRSNTAHHLAGLLVAGVSARLRFDDAYVGFFELVSSQIATAIARARAYEEERQRAEALAALDRAKTTFFSNISHEFRTPLTLILGPLDDLLARKETLPSATYEELERIHRNGLRLLKLVNTLLDFARIEAGRVQAVYEPTDVATYTADLASSFRSLVERAGMRLLVDCPPLGAELSAPVYLDREMWEKVVLNLLSNAFKFTFTGSISVTLAAVEGGRAVELAVRDTGVGISAADLPRLFERFHRIEGTRARTHEGSGIGLALAQELIHLHGGTIRAESTEGVGTTFFVRVPVGAAHLPAERVRASAALASTALGAEAYVGEAARWLSQVPGAVEGGEDLATGERASSLVAADLGELPTRPTASAAPTSGATQQPARILLADDNADMREYLTRLLGAQYRVEAVANGAEALAAIQRERPDLVLSDVMMPELDGFGVLRALRTNPQTLSLPVILLSARAGEEATAEGLEAGADDYLVKPFSAREVLSRVATRLEIARSREASERRTHEVLEALLAMAMNLTAVPDAVPDVVPGPMADALGKSDDATQLALRGVMSLAQRVLAGQYTAAGLVNQETGDVLPLAVVGLTPEIERQWWRDVSRKRVEEFLPPSVLERLYADEVVTLDMAGQPPVPGQDYWGVNTVMFVSVRLDAERVLVFGVEARDRAAFTPQERDLAQAAAHLVALVLERDRLMREREQALANELVSSEAKRRMDEFLGIASHELRTPLTSITANVQMAKHGLRADAAALPDTLPNGLGGKLQRAELLLDRTERQLARMNRLVGDLLDVSRIQAGKLELRPEACDLLAIVHEAVEEQRAAWPKRSISLDLPRRAATLPIHADADRIGQVVTNYLTNALKYSAVECPVAVRVRVVGTCARVEVSDRGPGLTPEQRAQLFERFYRVPGIEQQSGSGIGLGLGLHICQTMIERHGGQVGVESAPGEGSTFWFTLPLATPLATDADGDAEARN